MSNHPSFAKRNYGRSRRISTIVSDTPPATAVTDIDQVLKEAITVNRIHPRVIDALISGVTNLLNQESDPTIRAKLEADLNSYNRSKGNLRAETEYAVSYLEGIEKTDPEHHSALIDFSVQHQILDNLIGPDKARQLVKDFNGEKVAFYSQIKPAEDTFPAKITDSAFAGQAIDRLRIRPDLGDLPTEVWSRLFAINIAESRLDASLKYPKK